MGGVAHIAELGTWTRKNKKIVNVIADKESVKQTKGSKVRMSWREDPATDKQLKLISEMCEFSERPIPAFEGNTKGEASDYIDKWIGRSHETYLNCWDTTQGIP